MFAHGVSSQIISGTKPQPVWRNGFGPNHHGPSSSHSSRASQLQGSVCCRPLMSTHERATRVERPASGTLSVSGAHGVGEDCRWEAAGGGHTGGAGRQERGNRCGCSTGSGWPEQCRARPVGAGVSGRLQGIPGWQRGWPLPRGRATFGDELDTGVRGGKAPRLQPRLSSPGRCPSQLPAALLRAASGVARCVSHHRQARMGRWGSRPVGQAV